MSPARVLTAGEALVDWVCTERGADLAQAASFVKSPGGAPMNVAVALARLGVPAAFAGRVGADPFGVWLRAILSAEGVDTTLMRTAEGRQTRMAYVVTNASGDRELAAFSDVACADAELSPGDVPDAAIASVRAFYFGSLALLGSPSREVVLDAAARMRRGSGLVVFDPNVRPVLWGDRPTLESTLARALAVADILKVGLEELPYMTEETEPSRAAAALLARYDLAAVVVTDGPQGAGAYTRAGGVWVPGFPVEAVEPTGAGDAFLAGLIAALLDLDDGASFRDRVAAFDAPAWAPLLRRASAAGALATTATGAIAALPTAAALDAFLAKHPL